MRGREIMTISEGMYAVLKLYYWAIVFVYFIVAIACLLAYWAMVLIEYEPEKEQARLTKLGE